MTKNNNSINRVLLNALLIVIVVLCVSTKIANAQTVSPNVGGNVEWSPDGTELAVIANNGIFIYDHNSVLLRYTLTPIDNYFAFGGWSPDGTKLLLGNQIWDAITLQLSQEILNYPRGWIASGEMVFTVLRDKIQLVRVSDGNIEGEIPVTIQIEYAYPSPDGGKIATVIANGLFIFDINQRSMILQSIQPRGIGSYAWSPDSSSIAYVTGAETDTGEVLISIIDIYSGEILATSQPFTEGPIIDWSHNGNRIGGITRNRDLYVWDTNTLDLLSATSLDQEITGNLDYSPFGGLIAVGQIPQSATQSSSTDARINLNAGEGIINDLANGAVSLVIPEPTQLGLQAITDACGLQPAADQALTAEISTQNYVGFTAQLEALPETALPPGCRADLLSVAAALEAQGR